MDNLKYKDYEGAAELGLSRNVCRGKILFIDDFVTYEAASPADLKKEFEAAVDDYLETCQAVGKDPQRPFRGLINVRISPALHRAAALRAAVDGVALNDVVVRTLDSFVNVRADVNHNIKFTVDTQDETIRTVASVASGKTHWGTAHVH